MRPQWVCLHGGLLNVPELICLILVCRLVYGGPADWLPEASYLAFMWRGILEDCGKQKWFH